MRLDLTCSLFILWLGVAKAQPVVKCPLLTPPAHGVLTPNADTTDGMEYGTGYAVGCATGYKLKGKEPGEELLWLCQQDGTWSGEQAECQDRKIFRSRSEWASFLGRHEDNCCPLWREDGYKWDYSRCDLNREVKWECITDRPWNHFKDHFCYREEINEKASMGRIDKDQTWYALLGVKVPKYYNQCCWNHPEKGPYDCYEYPSNWLV